MANITYSISKSDLFDLFGRLGADHRVFVPYAKGERLYFDDFDSKKESSIELGAIRQSQPLKSFLNYAREKILDGSLSQQRPLVIAGVKGCDLSGLTVQDFVFLGGDVKDPFYEHNRQRALIIASDCTSARQTCFCLAMEGAPYARAHFDLNLSVIDTGFLVEVGSDKGQAVIDSFKMFFHAASQASLDARLVNRDRVTKQVQDYINKRQTPATAQIQGMVKKHYANTELWQDAASTCVECGACNLVCPTCHCFLLYDEKDGRMAGRFRSWDACLYASFARVAGGHNPRRHLYERMRNRFDKKFAFFPEVLGHFACTGCGRCIEACPGDIDIREVLKGLVKGTWKKPPHE